jgi:hypothetical protein
LSLYKLLRANCDPIQGIADHCEILATGVGNDQPLTLAIEKPDAECGFQRLDLMAHSPMRHVELFSRSREALAARGSLKGLEGVQGWQTTQHARSS